MNIVCRAVLALSLLACSFAVSPVFAAMQVSAKSMAIYRNVAPTLESRLAGMGVTLGSPIFVRIFKESNELELWIQGKQRFQLYKTFEICSFSGDLGPKLREGDRQSPEGFYEVGAGQLNPFSRFHLSFNLGYPNEYDRARGCTGSALMVHGGCVSTGCFAMNNEQMDEIYTLAEAALKNGQEAFGVHVFPFRMTGENVRLHRKSPWRRFWHNLKEGYDLFEQAHVPPKVSVHEQRYVFESPSNETADNSRVRRRFVVN